MERAFEDEITFCFTLDSKITLIIRPNDVVDQWKKSIQEIFPNSYVITGREAFYVKYDRNKHQWRTDLYALSIKITYII